VIADADPQLIATMNSYVALCLSVAEDFEKCTQLYNATMSKKHARWDRVVSSMCRLNCHIFMGHEAVKMCTRGGCLGGFAAQADEPFFRG